LTLQALFLNLMKGVPMLQSTSANYGQSVSSALPAKVAPHERRVLSENELAQRWLGRCGVGRLVGCRSGALGWGAELLVFGTGF
jgi:hypothetical protein